MTIPKLTPYTGQVANPDGSQTQTEFTQNMFDQLSYEAALATELDATVDGMNQAVTDVEGNANAASASATAAEAAASTAGYQGLWPDTGGSALKGETWQTQVGGTPTSEYYTALQNTSVDPVGDDVNWKRNGDINRDNLSDYTNIVYKASGGNSAVENMVAEVPVPVTSGAYCSTGGTSWVKYSTSPEFRPLTVANVYDFGVNPENTASDNKNYMLEAFSLSPHTGVQMTVNYAQYPMNSITINSGAVYKLNGNGATIKTSDSEVSPMFNGEIGGVDEIHLTDINFDLNKDNLTPSNKVGNICWLGGGGEIGDPYNTNKAIFKRISAVNGYRASLNLLAVNLVDVEDYTYKDAGIDGTGFVAYMGITQNCNRVNLKNIDGENVVGYGWHIYRVNKFVIENSDFINFIYDNRAIGFTFTESKNGTVFNHNAVTDGDAMEINACEDLTIEQFRVESIGTEAGFRGRGLLVGDNATGKDNRRITLKNGSVFGAPLSSYSAAINYVHGMTIEQVYFNKAISFLTGADSLRSSDINFINSEIDAPIDSTIVDHRFTHKNTKFSDCFLDMNQPRYEMRSYIDGILPDGSSDVIPLSVMQSQQSNGFVAFVEVTGELTSAPGSQFGWRKYKVTFRGVNDASQGFYTIEEVDSAAGYTANRAPVVIYEGGQLVAKNTTGVDIAASWKVNGMTARRASV